MGAVAGGALGAGLGGYAGYSASPDPYDPDFRFQQRLEEIQALSEGSLRERKRAEKYMAELEDFIANHPDRAKAEELAAMWWNHGGPLPSISMGR